MQPPVQVQEVAAATATPEGSENSSYGMGDSAEHLAPENENNNEGSNWNGVVNDIKCAIASVDATQVIIVNKLEVLERAMVSVREDTSWVRGDVEVVHALVENMSEDVCMIGHTLREVRATANGGPEVMSAWGAWKDVAEGVVHERVDRTEIEEEDRVNMRDAERRDIHVHMNTETSIEETQAFDMNTDMTGGLSRSLQGAAGDARQGASVVVAFKRPTGTMVPTPIYDAQNPADDGCEEIDQTLDITQTGTRHAGRSLWEDFSSTVREIAAPVVGAGTSKEGWIRCVRERGVDVEEGEGHNVESVHLETAGPSNLNLNLALEKRHSYEELQAGGGTTSVCGRGQGGRGFARGAGRGAGRGKRLPAVFPRFGSTASTPHMLYSPCHAAFCSIVEYANANTSTVLVHCVKPSMLWMWWTQDLVRAGAHCWVLHPRYGGKPVAEGVAGSTPAQRSAEGGLARSLLMELCEDGQQMVQVTKVHKKNTELMYPEETAMSAYLDEFLTPPAPSNTFVTWSTRYLVEIGNEG